MQIIDLSLEIFEGIQVHSTQPQVTIERWNDHATKVAIGATTYSSASIRICMGDHTGTHVDAPLHFDPAPDAQSVEHMPLEQFYAPGFCLHLPDTPLKHALTPSELEAALAEAGQTIHPGDVVLFELGTHARLRDTPGYETDFPGLAPQSICWLADRGVKMFGVEAISPTPAGELNLLAHKTCAERGITHIECLNNLEALRGRGRFTFIGFPLKIRGGTAGPMRAVALFD